MSMPIKPREEDDSMTVNDFMPIITGLLLGFIMYGLSFAMLPITTLTTIYGFEVLLQPTIFVITTLGTVLIMLIIGKEKESHYHENVEVKP